MTFFQSKKLGSIVVTLMGFLLIFSIPMGGVAPVNADDAAKGPLAYLPESLHEFKTVMEGDSVFHDFVIQNRGDAPLVIVKVRAG